MGWLHVFLLHCKRLVGDYWRRIWWFSISKGWFILHKQKYKGLISGFCSEQRKDQEQRPCLELPPIKESARPSIHVFLALIKLKMHGKLWRKNFKGIIKLFLLDCSNFGRTLKFDYLTMKESKSIKYSFSKVTEIVNQIRAYGDQIEEKKIVEKILKSLPPKFNHAVLAIEEL